MNLLYCGDRNIEDGLYISILSVLKNIKEPLNIYVFTITMQSEKYNIQGVTNQTIEFLNNRIKQENKKNNITKIDITEMFKKQIPTINMDTRFTPCCMLRLFADQVPELPGRILYFDNDIIVRKDFSEFYNQDMTDFEIAGSLDYYGKWFFKNNLFKFDYINSGVLLLNLDKIKETGLFEQARKLCIEEKMFMPDQSALNKLAKEKKIMPRCYNEQKKLRDDTIIQHFTTGFKFFPWIRTVTIKPWDVENVHKKLKIFEYDDILIEYENNREKMKEGRKVVAK